ncbi:MAG: transglutaminase-like domain-containing protein, partial [Terriglobales bacterium]
LWLNRPAELLRYQVTLEPIASPVLFFPSQLLRTSTHLPVLGWDRRTATLTAATSDNSSFAGATYSGISNLAEPAAGELMASPPPSRRDMRFGLEEFLELPPNLDPRIRELAHTIVAHVPGDNWNRMQALSEYLRTHYQYTVDALPQGEDPLATFLFDQPQGDCEYFASALAVMGRVLDIPTRVVNGFLGGTFNSISGEYVVRGRDAHSWVEAYFPTTAATQRARGWRYRRESGSWVRFDATPADSTTAAGNGAGMVLDALSSFWQEWIVNYDRLQQAGLARQLEDSLGGAASLVQSGNRMATTALQSITQPRPWNQRPLDWGLSLVGLCGVGFAAGWGLWRGRWHVRWGGWSWPRRDEAETARRSATRMYHRFQACLSGLGVQRDDGQTAPELVAALQRKQPDLELTRAAATFAIAYEAMRFGPTAGDRGLRQANLARAFLQVQRQARALPPPA